MDLNPDLDAGGVIIVYQTPRWLALNLSIIFFHQSLTEDMESGMLLVHHKSLEEITTVAF